MRVGVHTYPTVTLAWARGHGPRYYGTVTPVTVTVTADGDSLTRRHLFVQATRECLITLYDVWLLTNSYCHCFGETRNLNLG